MISKVINTNKSKHKKLNSSLSCTLMMQQTLINNHCVLWDFATVVFEKRKIQHKKKSERQFAFLCCIFRFVSHVVRFGCLVRICGSDLFVWFGILGRIDVVDSDCASDVRC